MSAEKLLQYWFGSCVEQPRELPERRRIWFVGESDFDDILRRDFAAAAHAAAAGEYDGWRTEPRTGLALLLLLDQLPRNLYRDDPRSYATDPAALAVADLMLASGMERNLAPVEAAFIGMPFEHAENLEAQDRAVAFFLGLCDRVTREPEETLRGFVEFARSHRDVIARFGRFPHRNRVLGRETTAAEESFMKAHGRGFA